MAYSNGSPPLTHNILSALLGPFAAWGREDPLGPVQAHEMPPLQDRQGSRRRFPLWEFVLLFAMGGPLAAVGEEKKKYKIRIRRRLSLSRSRTNFTHKTCCSLLAQIKKEKKIFLDLKGTQHKVLSFFGPPLYFLRLQERGLLLLFLPPQK